MEAKIVIEKIYLNVEKDFNDMLSKYSNDKVKFDNIKKSKYSIFYTNPFNTLKKGDFYFTGLNPGGSTETCYKRENLNSWDNEKKNFSAYIDENWKDETTRSKMQISSEKVLLQVKKNMKMNDDLIHDIFSTNINFFRSKGASTMISHLDACWKYHEEFLKIVQPKIIICNGCGNNSAFKVFKNKCGIKEINNSLPIGKTTVKYFHFENSDWGKGEKLVLGLPHLSWYSPGDNYISSLNNVFFKERK